MFKLLGLHALNKVEQELALSEQAWADCAHGLRTGNRIDIRPGKEIQHVNSIASLHGSLEGYRRDYESGDAAAVLWALRLCLEENLPAPYWCADAFLARLEKVEDPRANTDLHVSFGLARMLPLGKKGWNARRNNNNAMMLWAAAQRHHAAHPHDSKESCIKAALQSEKIRISQRKARDLFDAVDARQAQLRAARGTKAWTPFPSLKTLAQRRSRK